MSIEQIRQKISEAGYSIIEESRLPNGAGTKIEVSNGCVVNVFDSGTIGLQGINQEQLRSHLPQKIGKVTGQAVPLAQAKQAQKQQIFVVYGHDEEARTQLEAMLRRWDLEPLILDQLPSEGQTIIEKLEKYTAQVDFGVVLATPDDEGHKAGRTDEKAFRARQNVVLELGMLLSRLGRSRVAVIIKQTEKMERPSDIQGLIYIPFKDNLSKEAGVFLAKELAARGYKIDIQRV